MPEAPLSLLEYVRRQFGGDREQRFDFLTVAGEKVSGTFAVWPEADDHVIVVTVGADRLHVIVVAHLVYVAEHRATDPREALSNLGGRVRDVGTARLGNR
jgi:hypothetical protein